MLASHHTGRLIACCPHAERPRVATQRPDRHQLFANWKVDAMLTEIIGFDFSGTDTPIVANPLLQASFGRSGYDGPDCAVTLTGIRISNFSCSSNTVIN